MLFAYDFPHYKSQEILVRLFAEGYPIKYVILAPFRKLKRAETQYRDAPSYAGMMDLKMLCERLGIPYLVAPHNSEEAEAYIREHPVKYGILAGAQIIKGNIISLFPDDGGVINTHEAMLPWVRGLDVLKWSVKKDLPIANSIHFITEAIDEGRLIYQEKVEIREDDTPIDVTLRFIQMKPDSVVKALRVLETTPKESLVELGGYPGNYHGIMELEEAKQVMTGFSAWCKKHAGPAMPLDPFSEPYRSIGETP